MLKFISGDSQDNISNLFSFFHINSLFYLIFTSIFSGKFGSSTAYVDWNRIAGLSLCYNFLHVVLYK